MNEPCGVIADTQGIIVVADSTQNQLLCLDRELNIVMQLLNKHHITEPVCLYLDSEQHISRLYVSGRDHDGQYHLFIYDYTYLINHKSFSEIFTKMDMTMEL